MSAQIDTDISDAIAALGESLTAIRERLEGQDERIAELKEERKDRLDGEVERLIPDISDSSLQRLQKEMPDFVDAAVQSAFAGHRKFLGLFAGAGYRQALLGLQTRLAHRLEGGRDPVLKESGRELTHLLTERDELARLQSHTQGMFDQLDKMQNVDKELPAAIREEIARIAEKAREMKKENAQRKKDRADTSSDDDDSVVSDWHDDYTWIDFAADLSADIRGRQSMRAGSGSFDGAGASDDFSSDDSSSSRSRSDNRDSSDSSMPALAAYLAAGIGDTSADRSRASESVADSSGVGIPDIATDDSLGTFS